jgi:hypothetical protein
MPSNATVALQLFIPNVFYPLTNSNPFEALDTKKTESGSIPATADNI